MNIPPLMESFFPIRTLLRHLGARYYRSSHRDREVSSQKYQDTLEQARYDNGVIGEHPFLFYSKQLRIDYGFSGELLRMVNGTE
jgi:hypothetical protein